MKGGVGSRSPELIHPRVHLRNQAWTSRLLQSYASAGLRGLEVYSDPALLVRYFAPLPAVRDDWRDPFPRKVVTQGPNCAHREGLVHMPSDEGPPLRVRAPRRAGSLAQLYVSYNDLACLASLRTFRTWAGYSGYLPEAIRKTCSTLQASPRSALR